MSRFSISVLSRQLNYEFKEPDLLIAALSHRSSTDKSNERLEFLGDAVLNFIIASALYELCPQAQEGDLSRLRANLVKGETLACIAQEFQIGQYLRLGLGELKSGGAKRQSILADALEAIIGAIYLDSGFESCRTLVLKWYDLRLQAIKEKKTEVKDAKTRLQEYLQARKQALPTYTVSKTQGAMHEQIFTIQCRVNNLPYTSEGNGSSRRKAEQLAAAEYFSILKNQVSANKKKTKSLRPVED